MPDFYQLPALILIALLLPGFAYLYFRFRDTRSLLWFLGFLLAAVRLALLSKLGRWNFQPAVHPWIATASEAAIQISSALFLASFSPLRFKLGRFQILYVIPYTLPLLIYAVLFYVLFRGTAPSGPVFVIFPTLGLLSIVAGFFWAIAKGNLPTWLGISICAGGGFAGICICYTLGPALPLTLVESCNHILTALLIIYALRRWSPGTLLCMLGFLLWSTRFLLDMPPGHGIVPLLFGLTRAVMLAKVVAALGLILLALEDQLGLNQAAQERERRARRELEAYLNLILSRRRLEDFDRQAADICQTVTLHSRFAQAALILQSGGRYRLAGSAGLDPAIATALDELAVNLPLESFLAPGSAPPAVEHSHTLNLNLAPWLRPGDDLKRLHFTSVFAVPMTGRSVCEGALLLSGMRKTPIRGTPGFQPQLDESLRLDDLLPLEMLTSRLQATRSQTMMLEKLIDSEKFAGLGQLAGSVTQQLNNPLTVILGYASLLDETSSLDPQERRGIESILSEARRMRSTLESLTRISRPQNSQFTAVSVSEMLTDLEQLHRSEFLQRSIDFRLNIAPGLPRVRCHAQQLRQAVLHCVQFAIEAVENKAIIPASSLPGKTVRLEASSEGNLVQILVAHSGPGFVNPERAFDPFVPAQATGETTGLGLSLCATILRDHNGRASALNLEPSGAAIILELRAA